MGEKNFQQKSNDKHHRLITKITVRPSFLRLASTTRGVRAKSSAGRLITARPGEQRRSNGRHHVNTTRRREVHGRGFIRRRRESLSTASTIGKSERRTWHDRTTDVSTTTTSTVWRRDIDVKGLIDRHIYEKKENKKKCHKKRIMKTQKNTEGAPQEKTAELNRNGQRGPEMI